MSCSTNIVDDQGKGLYQFKTGFDGEESLKVGDKVHMQILADAGCAHLNDDLYLAYNCATKEEDAWVVVKDGVVSLLPVGCTKDGSTDADYAQKYVELEIVPLPLTSWSTEAWAHKAKYAEECERANLKYDGEVLLKRRKLRNVVRDMMQQDGFFRRIMSPIQIPDAALATYPALPEKKLDPG